MKQSGCQDFHFTDLRLFVADVYCPTFDSVGVFGESYVSDIPDLPLALRVISNFDHGRASLAGSRDKLFDNYAYERGLDPAVLHAYLVGMDHLVEDAFGSLPDLRFVGFSTWLSNFTTTLMAAARLKRRRAPPYVVCGGPQVTESRAAALLGLQSGLFDAVVLGEGETALVDVFRAHEERRPAASVAGVVTLHSAERATTSRRTLLAMSNLPTPDFTDMPLHLYGSTDQLRLPFQLSRGCTDKCTFCSEWVFWQHFRSDTAAHCVNQLAELKARYRVNRFHFTDSLINGHMIRLRQFAEELISRNLEIEWGGFMRADMDGPTARLLKAAGLRYAFIGIESLADETLNLMNKRRTAADNLNALRALMDADVPVAAGVIPGFPGDSRDRFLQTVQRLTEIADDYPSLLSFNVEPFVISPSQPLYGRLSQAGLTPHAWDDAVLDIAPAYRAITSGIHCSVSGANQGVERVGQLKLLHVLLARHSIDATIHQSNHDESLRPSHVNITRVRSVFLVQAKSRGRIVGCILVESECAECVSLVQSGSPRTDLFDRCEFRALWDRAVEQHAWRSLRRVLPVCIGNSTTEPERVFLPDHVVARVIEPHGDGAYLLLANVITGSWTQAEVRTIPILRWLAEEPRTWADVEGQAASFFDDGIAICREIERLQSQGFVDSMPAPNAAFTDGTAVTAFSIVN